MAILKYSSFIRSYIPLEEKGAALGVAELNASGYVPVNQLGVKAEVPQPIEELFLRGDHTWQPISDITGNYIPYSEKGVELGVATLDNQGKVPIEQIKTGTSFDTVALGNHSHAYIPLADRDQPLGVPTLLAKDSNDYILLKQENLGRFLGIDHPPHQQFLCGDRTWKKPTLDIGESGVELIWSEPVGTPNRQSKQGRVDLEASDILTGTFIIDRLPVGTSNTTVARGNHTHSQFNDFIPYSEKAAADGVATLDESLYNGSIRPKVPVNQLGDGTASSSTFLCGDRTWKAIDTSTTAGVIKIYTSLTGTPRPFVDGNVTFDGSYILTGKVHIDRLPTGTSSSTVALGNHIHDIADTWVKRGQIDGLASLNGSGRVPLGQLGSGTPSTSTYLRGDGAWYNLSLDFIPRSEKAQANGVATLDNTIRVPVTQLGTGDATNSTFLRGDRTWQPIATIGNYVELIYTNAAKTQSQSGKITFNGSWILEGTVPFLRLPVGVKGTLNAIKTTYSDRVALDEHLHHVDEPWLKRGSANGVASLNENSKVPIVQLPVAEATAVTRSANLVSRDNHTHTEYIPMGQRGTANGVATLDGTTQVPIVQLGGGGSTNIGNKFLCNDRTWKLIGEGETNIQIYWFNIPFTNGIPDAVVSSGTNYGKSSNANVWTFFQVSRNTSTKTIILRVTHDVGRHLKYISYHVVYDGIIHLRFPPHPYNNNSTPVTMPNSNDKNTQFTVSIRAMTNGTGDFGFTDNLNISNIWVKCMF